MRKLLCAYWRNIFWYFCALVRKQGRREKQLYILSANHVLAACNHIPVDMPILSPSSADGGPTLSAPREIGRHAEICELRSGEPSLVSPCSEDVALARVTEPNHVTSWQGPVGSDGGYDTPTNAVAVRDGMRVKKIGRTTGLTQGTVEAKLVPFPLPYKLKPFSATVWFKEMWSIRADSGKHFALAGDSGSLVVTEDGSAAVGLLFAASPSGDVRRHHPDDTRCDLLWRHRAGQRARSLAMTVHEAAEKLAAHLRRASWLTAVGVGKKDERDCIYLYVKSSKRADIAFLDGGWEGFPVVIRRTGAFQPLNSGTPFAEE